MMYHDNSRRDANPAFRPAPLTLQVCKDRARLFVHSFVRPGLQWEMRDLRNYGTPAGYYLPDSAIYSGSATITDIAHFLRANLRRVY